jgi:hypothetical protein
MSNKDLFKEAIADAKAVREAALANAKVALEEALAPKLQSMLSAKLQEMDMDDLEAEEEELQEKSLGQDTYRTDDFQHVGARERHAALEEEELEEDFDLSSILAELSDDEDKMNEAEDESEEVEVEDEESEDEAEMEDEEAEDEEMEDASITDLTMDELKDIIKDIISSEMGGDEEMDADMEDMGGEDEMSLDLGGEEGGDEVSISDEEEIDEIDLEELLAELDALGESDDEDKMYEAKKKKEDDKDEMKEAIDTIETLRNELNEVNLLNAKLLYVNKIFKAKNLNESQKLKVIAQFDKANTAKEAKAIFESMNSAIAKSKKSTIKESLGFASKAAGVAPKKPIVDETMSRWQMLAGITKY